MITRMSFVSLAIAGLSLITFLTPTSPTFAALPQGDEQYATEINTPITMALFTKFGQFDLVATASEAVGGTPTNVESQTLHGHSAVTFDIELAGTANRGIAVDLGNNVAFLFFTSDATASRRLLLNAARTQLNAEPEFLGVEGHEKLAAVSYDPCSCVSYARSQCPSLPHNLDTVAQKQAIVNHFFPRVGSVAVHNYNHVSVVRNVVIRSDGNLQISLQEANYVPCQVTTRTGTPEQLGIYGYFDPAYPSRQTAPRIFSRTPGTARPGIPVDVTISGSGFDQSTARVQVFGGWCNTFDRCVVPNSALLYTSASSIRVRLTLNNAGSYRIYVTNGSNGKTSNGTPIVVNY